RKSAIPPDLQARLFLDDPTKRTSTCPSPRSLQRRCCLAPPMPSPRICLGATAPTEICGQCFPGADQLSDRFRIHLPHDIAAVKLNRDLADAQVEGNLFVQAPERDLAKDLPLAWRERGEPIDMPPDDARGRPLLHVPRDTGG